MAGFSSYDQIIDAITHAQIQTRPYQKINFGSGTGVTYSLWNVLGIPASGTFGTALTARRVSSSFQGAIPFTNPTAGRQAHLINVGMANTLNAGTYILYDRLVEAPFDGTATNAIFNSGSPIVIPDRDMNGTASGTGCMMFVENVANTVLTAASITVRYTNSAGATGHVTASRTLAGKQHEVSNSNNGSMWLPLQVGDTGVQAISGYTLTGSLTSTQLNIVIARPIAYLSVITANSFTEKDLIMQIANMPRIYDNSALGFVLQSNQATNSGISHGQLVFIEN